MWHHKNKDPEKPSTTSQANVVSNKQLIQSLLESPSTRITTLHGLYDYYLQGSKTPTCSLQKLFRHTY